MSPKYLGLEPPLRAVANHSVMRSVLSSNVEVGLRHSEVSLAHPRKRIGEDGLCFAVVFFRNIVVILVRYSTDVIYHR